MDSGGLIKPKELKLTNVPYTRNVLASKYHLFLVLLLLFTPTVLHINKCEVNTLEAENEPATSLYDFYLDRFSDFIDSTNDDGKHFHPTPPIAQDSSKQPKVFASKTNQNDHRATNIRPARVYRFAEVARFEPESDLFSPVFNMNSMALEVPSDYGQYQNDAQPADGPSYADLIDSGSGNFENPAITGPEDSTNLLEESGGYGQSSIAPTPVLPQTSASLTPTPNLVNENNQPPYLNRKLPKLAVTAGQVWKFFIPSDTFLDEEEGDLRKLRSAIVRKDSSPNLQPNSSGTDFAQYYSWIQYDATSQLLYGLPTDNDVGRHELNLIVGDQSGATNQETIEIHVRQHQSSRAFTHQFQINDIFWEPEKFPSMVDALGELVKQISTRVFMDRAFENFIIHHYTINEQQANNSSSSGGSGSGSGSTSGLDKDKRMSFNLAWSNSSVPIHPCNLGQIESLMRPLINTQFLRPDWSSSPDASGYKLPPSASMLRILEPDFRPESISITLLGSCDSRELFKDNSTPVQADNSESRPEVRVKIGTLNWKLGQPIEYRIPVATFGSDRGAYTTRDLQLSLHTIDGLPLDKDPSYSFINFDQEAQIIYGLPFHQEDHSGQRELLITSSHPKSGFKVRDVIVINIESQDLTTINNRAFQMSLYFRARIAGFDAQEKVFLSQKVVAATGQNDALHQPSSSIEKRMQQITVTSIAKNINRAQLMSLMQVTGSPGAEGDYVEITRFEQKTDLSSLDLKEANAPVYKFTWTNESIGSSGDCPVEVIKENILYSLEQSMLDFKALDLGRPAAQMDEQNKSDSTRFLERLRQYFEPELDLVHLRFEPLGACMNAMEVHDVGNSELADLIDRANELELDLNQETNSLLSISQVTPPRIDNNEQQSSNEEYWSIVVLLVLVVTLIFVIIMFFMGMHTYKINQDKRFEMQVKLAQARQNSMYLSSMILANLASPNDCGSAAMPNGNRNMCIIEDEEKASRKPVILENEKHLLTDQNSPRSMAVLLNGSSVRTTPVKQNSVLTLDSMAGTTVAGWQPSVVGLSMSPSALLYTPSDGKHRSMTLNRRSSAQRQVQLPPDALNHSQSILTVASLAGPMPIIPQGNIPLMYAPVLPLMSGPAHPAPYNYASLQRVHHQGSPAHTSRPIYPENQFINEQHQQQQVTQMPQQSMEMNNSTNQPPEIANTRMKSSSRSSSVSATTNSVISNPNYSPHR